MSGIEKKLLSHTLIALSQHVLHAWIYYSLNIEGMGFFTAYINWLILSILAPNRIKWVCYLWHLQNVRRNNYFFFIVRRIKASVVNLMSKNPFSALYTLGRTKQTEDFDIPWMSPSFEKSAFTRKRKVHSTGITALYNNITDCV